jgi:copper chaperone
MFVFSVKDMSSSDSAAAIVRAVKAVDGRAGVFIDTERLGVEINPVTAGATALSDAIIDAGFTPVLLPGGRTSATGTPSKIPFVGPDHDFTPGGRD